MQEITFPEFQKICYKIFNCIYHITVKHIPSGMGAIDKKVYTLLEL